MVISDVSFNIEKETAWPKYQSAMAKCGLNEDDISFIWNAIAKNKSGQLDVLTRAHPDFALPSSAFDIGFQESQNRNPKAGTIVVKWQYNEVFVSGMVSMKIYQL